MGEELYELPKGWVWASIGEILDPSPEKVDPSKLQQNLPYIGLEHIDKNTGRLLSIGNSIEVRSTKTKFYSEDLLYGKLRPYLNKVHVPIFEGICSTDILVFSKNKYISSRYIAFRFLAKDFVRFANQNVSGVQHPRIDFKTLSRFKIPLPPLPEQYRIVAKIEELFTELDAGVELLKKLKAKLKRYRQAVLKAAVEGSLTQEWRTANQGKLEPASMLLERILKQRREKWEAEQLAKMKAQGKTPKDDSWKLKYKEPIAPDTSELPELPDGWCWQSFGQAFNVYVGATPSRKRLDFWEGTIPWVSSGEVAFCRIYNTEEKITQLGLENSSTEIHPPGTVLLGMIGEGKTRGQVAILDIPACHNQNSAAIRVSETGMPPEYIYYFLEGEYERTRKLGSGNNQPALNKNRVQLMVFPCPPLKEQYKIAEELQLKFSITDQLEKTIDSNLKRAEKLRQSILKQAFEGKLVPQDPNDEPAEKLLERIKAEKAKQTTTKTKKKTQSKKQSDFQLEIPLK